MPQSFTDGPAASANVDPNAAPPAPAPAAPAAPQETQQPAAPAPVSPAAPVAQEPTSGDGKSETPIDSLPEYWQKEIKSLRNENAKRRVGDDSVLTDRIAALEAQVTAANTQRETAEKTAILAQRGLDPKFLPMITGDTAEAWGKAADSLVELRGSQGGPRPDPVQVAGQSNTTEMSEAERRAALFFSALDK